MLPLCLGRHGGQRQIRVCAGAAPRILAFPVGESGTRSVTDEGMQAGGTAWRDAPLSSIPHQAPTLRTFFHRENSARRIASRTALPLAQGSLQQGTAGGQQVKRRKSTELIKMSQICMKALAEKTFDRMIYSYWRSLTISLN
mgnify:CR=1 FL=1